MKSTIRNCLISIIFCAVLLTLFLVLVFGCKKPYSEREKRYLAEAPSVTAQALADGTFRDELEAWVEDQFPGRDIWVGLNAYANYLLGRNVTNSIYKAGDGYLINAPVSDDLSKFESSLKRFDSFSKKLDLPASMIMVPSTGWLKQDILPVGHGTYPDDAMYQKAVSQLEHISCVDLRQQLRSADAAGQVAYRTDHHLTSYGNYTLYIGWRDLQGKEYRDRDKFTVETIDGFYGTTWSGSGYWLTSPDAVELWDSGVEPAVTIWDGEEETYSDTLFFREHAAQADKYPVFLDGNHALTTISNPKGTEGVLLVIKDSYAHGFVPFLAEHYETIYMIDLRYYRGNISEFAVNHGVDELLFIYGTTTLLTDTNSAWLV